MALWLSAKPLVLASKSEVRRKILASAGLPVEVRAANIDERGMEARAKVKDAAAVAQLLAGAKAHTVATDMPARLVIGADQTLAFETGRFSKPETRKQAWEQLSVLRGRSHRLHSALTVVRDGAVLFEHVETAELTMRDFSDNFIETYLDAAGDDALSSVGSYQIESAGVHLFSRISGDHYSILGLPLLPLLEFLRRQGLVAE
jgi:septum formation protein